MFLLGRLIWKRFRNSAAAGVQTRVTWAKTLVVMDYRCYFMGGACYVGYFSKLKVSF